ncbi:MAG: hypothetical protein AB4206_00950 [Xenococcaceae cyanobacterium]
MSDSDQPIFFRSSGLIRGEYLPSDNDSSQGILMTEHGLFPTICRQDLLKFLFKNNSQNRQQKNFQQKHQFLFYVYGLSEPPYYQFCLLERIGKSKIPKVFSENNTFVSQGIVTLRSSEQVILKVQKNIRPDRTSQEIEDSISFLIIKNCPGKVRTSQFWSFRSRLQDGFLHFKSGELLANAKIVKSYYKNYYNKQSR